MSIDTYIDEYKKTKWEKLLRPDLGEYHLGELKPHLDVIKNAIDDVIKNKDEIPNELIHQLEQILNDFNNHKQIIEDHRDTSQNENIISQIIQFKNILFEMYRHIFLALEFQKKYSSDKKSEISDRDIQQSKEVVQQYKKATKEIEEEVEKLKKAQSELSERTVRAEAKRYGEFFKNEAKCNKILSRRFGIALVIFSIVVCLIAWNFLLFDPEMVVNNIPELIIKGNLINKIFIFSVIFIIISVLKNEYLAQRHQYILNQHRHNALDSHKEILNAIKETENESEKEIANAILLELTKAMFSPQDTGFMKNSKNPSQSQVIEVSKSLLSTPKK